MGLLGFVTKKGAGTTPPLDTRGASLLIAFTSNYAPGSAANVTSDSEGNTWSGGTAQSVGNIKGRLFRVENPTTDEFHTISFGGDGSGIIFAAFSGTAISSAFEEENGYAAASVNGIQPGSVVPDNDGSLILAGCAVDNPVTQTVDSGFSIIADVGFEGGVNEGLALAYKIQSTAASINPQFAGGTASKAAVIMVIKPYIAPPDTDNPDDVILGSTTALSATSARFAFTPAEDPTTPISGILWQFDTVNTFDSGNLIETFIASNSGSLDKTGLLAGRRWYARAKAKDSASPTPNLSVNWSNTVYVDLDPVINTNSLDNAILGNAFSQTLSKTGDDGEFEIRSGAPSGFEIDAETGEITWSNPTPAGTIEDIVIRYTVTVSGLYDEETYSLTVIPAIIVPSSSWSQLGLFSLTDALFWNALDNAESAAEIGDYSGNDNKLAVASSAPVLQANIINGKPAVYFDGTKNPLKFTKAITLKHLFLIAKFDGAAFTGNEGLFSGVASGSILRGNGSGQTKFENLSIGSGYTYKKNFITLTESTQNAPMNAFAIIELIFPSGKVLDGVQIGQDTSNTGRKWKGWFVEQIGFGEVQDAFQVRDIYEFWAIKFHLWRKKLYSSTELNILPLAPDRPVELTEGDLAEISEAEGQRGQDKVVRYLNDDEIKAWNLQFGSRHSNETNAIRAFLKEHRLHLPYWFIDPELEIESRVVTVGTKQIKGQNNFSQTTELSIKEY